MKMFGRIINIALVETHKGICGFHQVGENMKLMLFQQGYFLPTILKDCINYAKSWEECQKIWSHTTSFNK